MLRSEYTTAINELGFPFLHQGENWQETGRFTIAAGMKFMARSGLTQPDAFYRVATSASKFDDSPGMIRPITLNIIGHVLSQDLVTAPSLDAGLLVRHYIEQSVEQPAIRAYAPQVLKELIAEQGTKWPRKEQEIVDLTGLRPGEVRAVMNGLRSAALARALDPTQGVWELSHDFVARAVSRYLGRRRLDWSGLARAFAAPVLFALMTAIVIGAIIGNANSAERLHAQLADFGVDVSQDEHEAAISPRFRAENWGKIGPLLGSLTSLQSLDLTGALIVDLAPLKGLNALRSLGLSDTRAADLAPLTGLSSLQTLNLTRTDVADIAPLKGLTALRSLDLSSTHVTDLAPLKSLTSLKSLNLAGTMVRDLAPLTGLTALQSLSLYVTEVADLAPIKGLTALQALGLSSTRVVDLTPIKGLTGLQVLDLDNMQITDLVPLEGLTALRWLDLAGTPVADLAPVQDLPNLGIVRGVPDAALQTLNGYRSRKGLPIVNGGK